MKSGIDGINADQEYWAKLFAIFGTKASQEKSEKDKIQKDFLSLKHISSIAHGCDWLAKHVCDICLLTVKHYQNQSSLKGKERNSLMRSTLIQRENSASNIVKENGLLQTIQAAAKELSKVAEESLAILRGEMQFAGALYLRQLTSVHLFEASAPQDNVTAANTKLSTSQSTSSNKANKQHEIDAIVSAFNHHLISMQDVMLSTASTSTFAVVFSPLIRLVPKLFLNNILYTAISALSTLVLDNYLKSAVACQQNMSMLLESTQFDNAVEIIIQSGMQDEFDHTKKFVSLLHNSAKDFFEYAKKYNDTFSRNEYLFVWKYLKEKYVTIYL